MFTISRKLAVLILIAVAVLVTGCSEDNPISSQPTDKPFGVAGDGNLEHYLDSIRNLNDLPALGVIVVEGDDILESAVAGVRVYGSSVRATIQDQWHIGSLTKSMTSMLAGVLIEDGLLDWGTTVGDVYPELDSTTHSDIKSIRLDELLSHTSGMTVELLDVGLPWDEIIDFTATLDVQRYQAVSALLTLPPTQPRGTYAYSNAGYLVAGAMLERVGGSSWEELISEELFVPLGMTSTGFGAPGTPASTDQPWGHIRGGDEWQSMDPGSSEADLPPVIGPAGTVHTSLTDYAAYLQSYLAGVGGASNLVSSSTYAKLTEPMHGTSSALGWVVNDGNLIHDGSNERWVAFAAVNPDQNTALFIVTNSYGENSYKGVYEMVGIIGSRFAAR